MSPGALFGSPSKPAREVARLSHIVRWGSLSREERFRSHLQPVESGCLEWTASRVRNGYGATKLVAGEWRAHRAAWVLAHGAIPVGLHVLHHCDNPPCCKTEPDERYPEGHLWLGTNADNKADFAAKGRGKGEVRPWQTGDNHWKRKRAKQRLAERLGIEKENE